MFDLSGRRLALSSDPRKSAGAEGVRGFMVSVASLISARAYLALSQVIVLPIMARQLTVEDFALMATAMTVVVFASTISDGGLGRSLIRAREADHLEWCSVFWLMCGVGLVLAGLTVALGPVAVWYFEAPRLTGLMAALATVPLLQAVSAAPNAEIEQREDYHGIARVQILATTVSLALAVALALLDAGVWALVAQQISLAGVRLMGILRLSRFRPAWQFSRVSLWPHLIFARDTLLVSVLVTLRYQVPVIVIGRMLGQIPLGYYSMSERLTRLPQFGLAGPMSTVVYVRMAKAQADPARLCAIYLASMRLLALLTVPSMAVVAVAGIPVFTMLLSPEWVAVAPVFAGSIGGLVIEGAAIFSIQPLFRVLARTDCLVRLNVEGLLLRCLLVGLAALHSLEAVAWSLTLWAAVLVPRCWQMAAGLIPLRLRDCLRTLLPSAVAALIACAAYLAVAVWLAPGTLLATLIAAVLAAGGCALAAALDWRGTLAAFRVFRAEKPMASHAAP